MKGMNNRQKMVVKAHQDVQKFLKESWKIKKDVQRTKKAGKTISSFSNKPF